MLKKLKLFSVDNNVVLPVDTNVRLQVTAGDVIHSWGVPAFGIKIDAIPGRLNEAWFNVKKPGVYYGQCYELCGQGFYCSWITSLGFVHDSPLFNSGAIVHYTAVFTFTLF